MSHVDLLLGKSHYFAHCILLPGLAPPFFCFCFHFSFACVCDAIDSHSTLSFVCVFIPFFFTHTTPKIKLPAADFRFVFFLYIIPLCVCVYAQQQQQHQNPSLSLSTSFALMVVDTTSNSAGPFGSRSPLVCTISIHWSVPFLLLLFCTHLFHISLSFSVCLCALFVYICVECSRLWIVNRVVCPLDLTHKLNIFTFVSFFKTTKSQFHLS